MLDTSQPIRSLADVPAHHSADQKRLKAHLSAISRTTRFLNRAEADIPTDVPQLRRLLIDLHPAQCGVAPQSLRTVKSALAAALRAAGVLHDHTGQIDLTVDWKSSLIKSRTITSVTASSALPAIPVLRVLHPKT